MVGRRFIRLAVALTTVWALPVLATYGCSGNDATPAPKVGLMVSIESDMSIPKDIATMYLEVTENGVVRHGLDYQLGALPDQPLPGTLALIPGRDPTIPAKIRVVAKRKDGSAVVMRQAITTVPTDRVALLPLTLRWLCWGGVEDTTTDPSTPTFENTKCASDETCVAGSCQPQVVDSKSLPDFKPELVFGGAKLPGVGGVCFDTIGCFAGGVLATVDIPTCSVDAPTGPPEDVNLALLLPSGDPRGICSNGVCLVPLDRDDQEGWKTDTTTGRLDLPSNVCDRLGQDIVGVIVSSSCKTKTFSAPVCGPWSAVTNNAGTFDASLPFDATLPEGGDAGADVSSDGGSDSGSDASDAPPAETRIGQACTSSNDCGPNLTCLTSGGGPEWPANGICTLTCTDSATCQALNPSSTCAPLPTGTKYCLEGCAQGTASAPDGGLDAGLDPTKCHGRADMACQAYFVGDGGSSVDVCMPTCVNDAECGGLCNPASGLCTSTQSSGGVMGDSCGGTQPACSGACLPITSQDPTTTACTSACTLGVPGACNAKVGGQAATLPMGCMKDGVPDITDIGDLGTCVQLCDSFTICCPPGLECRPITDPALQSFYAASGLSGTWGYCDIPDADGGTMTCG